ncbi:MAG TPA: DNA polymerase III subunit gamma/tau [Nitrospirales bacterium]|nr:DNA polymerase III subunit gamma/tau [Nitrospirales bacterium]
MDYQVSARKFRPGTFEDVIGQSHVVQTLINSITTKRIAHAFLFSGTRGVGKTTVARIMAKALNCEQGPTGTPCDRCANCVEITQGTSTDVIEIDGASNTGVDDVREIRENVKFTPFRGKYRVYIIDEVHMLSNSAFNALLKTLEEPPPHVVFIFATTEIHKIPATILSRCQHYNFRRISRAEIIQRLRHVASADELTVDDRSLAALARAAEGSMRDALCLLDQAVAFGGKTIRHDDLQTLLGAVPHEQVRAMVGAIVAQDGASAIRVIATLLDQGHDLRAYVSDVVEYLRNLLIISIVPAGQRPDALAGLVDLADEDLRQAIADASALTTDHLQDLFRIFSQCEETLRATSHPRFALEAAAVRATRLTASQTAAPTTPAAPDRPTVTARPAPTPVTAARPTPAPLPRATASTPASPPPATPTPPPAAPAPQRTAAPFPENTWEKVVERIEQQYPNIAPFLAMGRMTSVEGDRFLVAYPPTASVAATRIQTDDAQRAVADASVALLGRPMRIQVIELSGAQSAGPTVAQLRAEKERAQKQTLLQQTKSHPLVKQAVDVFGGDVVEVRSPREEDKRG